MNNYKQKIFLLCALLIGCVLTSIGVEFFSKDDELVFKHEISKRYNNLVVDTDSDGVWCLKKNDKDPLFIGHDDGFYIYEIQE